MMIRVMFMITICRALALLVIPTGNRRLRRFESCLPLTERA